MAKTSEIHPETRPGILSPFAIAMLIVRDCGLDADLDKSVCLSCASRVLVQDSGNRATLYCKALHRDLETCITRCTHFTEG